MDYAKLGFEHSPAALVVLSYRIIQAANQAFSNLFGYPQSALINRSIATLFPTIKDYEKIGENAMSGLRAQQFGYYRDERFMQHQSGEVFWCQCVSHTLTPDDPFKLVICNFEKRAHDDSPNHSLTKRELEIVHYVANGLTCKQIGKILQLSPRTVEVHKANLMKKLNVKNKRQLLTKNLLVNSQIKPMLDTRSYAPGRLPKTT